MTGPAVDLEAAKAAFFAKGGTVEVLESFKAEPLPLRRSPEPDEPMPVAEAPVSRREQKRNEQAALVRKLAKTMTYSEAIEASGLSQATLYRIAVEGGFRFRQNPAKLAALNQRQYRNKIADRALAARIIELRDSGLSRHAATIELRISNDKLRRITRDYGINYPRQEGKRCDGAP